jgi:hypothetical protein
LELLNFELLIKLAVRTTDQMNNVLQLMAGRSAAGNIYRQERLRLRRVARHRLSNAGVPPPSITGFALSPGQSRAVAVADGWSGRMWGRTLCGQDSSSGSLELSPDSWSLCVVIDIALFLGLGLTYLLGFGISRSIFDLYMATVHDENC